MNKSQRIRVNLNETGDKFLKVKLEQNVETLELLSLKIDQKDIYQSFNADYGVLVGRVLANGGVGIPNAKISIFIPIEDSDRNRPEIFAAYPYENPRDKNRDGKRYNLLPRVAREDVSSGAFKPKQPFGSFPTKEEVVTNETWLEVYDKYYKYSTISNNSGDYMLFGVPVGIQTVHMSVDITDIGEFSMSPIDMVTQLGYSENLFTSTGEIKPQRDLEDLPHIETQEISVDVVPFWGDTENFQIGITRQDFRIRAQLISNFVLFGSYFTMGAFSVNGDPDRANKSGDGTNNGTDLGFYRLTNAYDSTSDFRTNRVGDLNINVYTYPNTISKQTIDEDITNSGTTINPQTDIIKLDPSSYFQFIDPENGQFLLSIPCNRTKVITDEFGNKIPVGEDSDIGVFTEFLGMAFVEHENLDISATYERNWRGPNTPNNTRVKFKIPQSADFSLREERDGDSALSQKRIESNIWRKRYFNFEAGSFYSVAQFFPTKFSNNFDDPDVDGLVNNLDTFNTTNFSRTIGAFKTGGRNLVQQGEIDNNNVISGGTTGGTITGTTFVYDFPFNASASDTVDIFFGGQWMNMSMYFPQVNWTYATGPNRSLNFADTWLKDFRDGEGGKDGEWFAVGGSNIQSLIGGDINARFTVGRGLETSFVKIERFDITELNKIPNKGFNKFDLSNGIVNSAASVTTPPIVSDVNLISSFLYREPAIQSDAKDYGNTAFDERFGIDYSDPTEQAFLHKGMYGADSIRLLFDLNFI